MADDPKNPEIGELAVDVTDLAPVIVDLPPGDGQGLKSEQEGCDEVVDEIVANQPGWGAKAGVSKEEVEDLTATHKQIARIDKLIPVVAKLLELLKDTRAVLADKRERLIRAVAWSVDAKVGVKGNEVLVAKYSRSRAYRSALGEKAARTRKKNASAKSAADKADKGADEKKPEAKKPDTPPVNPPTPVDGT